MFVKKIKNILLFIIFIIFMLFLILKLYIKFNKNKEQVPVLMYHQVINDEYFKNQSDTISLSMFEKQLKYLKDNNYKTLTLNEFYCWKKSKCKIPKKSVLLTFDDGFYSFHYLVEPLLEKYDFNAVNFLIGTTIEDKTKEYDSKSYGTIGMDLIKSHSSHVEYQSHSYSMHSFVNSNPKIYSMSEAELQKDIDNMKKIYNFEYISYPYNTDTDKFIKVLKNNGYKLAFRGESEKVTKDCNDFKIPRIGAKQDFNNFKEIFETDKKSNRYGNGLLRKILITIERKLNIKLG